MIHHNSRNEPELDARTCRAQRTLSSDFLLRVYLPSFKLLKNPEWFEFFLYLVNKNARFFLWLAAISLSTPYKDFLKKSKLAIIQHRNNYKNRTKESKADMLCVSCTCYRHEVDAHIFATSNSRWNFTPTNQSTASLNAINWALIFDFITSPSGKKLFCFRWG